MATAPDTTKKLTRLYAWLLLVGGVVGLLASFGPAIEKIKLLEHPNQPLICNINPVVACSNVLNNHWTSVFGFPNSFIGIAIFAILTTAGVALLFGGEKLKRGFWRFIMAVNFILICFALWFFSMSLYVIGSICVFCIFVWLASVPIFWFSLLAHSANGWLTFLPSKFGQWAKTARLSTLWIVPLLVYLTMIVLVLARFRAYFFA